MSERQTVEGQQPGAKGAAASGGYPSMVAILWFLTAAGWLCGTAFLVMAFVGLRQRAPWWLALAPGLMGLVVLGSAVWIGRILGAHRRARVEHAAAQAEFDAATVEARTRLGLDDDPR